MAATVSIKQRLDEIGDTTTELVETRIRLLKLQAAEQATKAGADALSITIVMLLISCGVLFLGLALAGWLAKELNDPIMADLLVGAVYFVLLIIMLICRKAIIVPLFRNFIVKKIYDK